MRDSMRLLMHRPDGYRSLRIDGVPIPRQPSTTDRPDEAATGDPTR